MHLLTGWPRTLLSCGRNSRCNSDDSASHARRGGSGRVQSQMRGTRSKISHRASSTRLGSALFPISSKSIGVAKPRPVSLTQAMITTSRLLVTSRLSRSRSRFGIGVGGEAAHLIDQVRVRASWRLSAGERRRLHRAEIGEVPIASSAPI